VSRKALGAIAVATALTVPWIGSVGGGAAGGFGTLTTVFVSGVAVLGASFLLTWGAETAEKDVPRAFAIAVLAVLAVAPEYAVDALYAWNAGAGGATTEACTGLTAAEIEAQTTELARACHDANLAVANMTGANRILIGVGWAGIALFTILRAGADRDTSVERRDGALADAVTLDRDIGLEMVFLLAATLWAFLVPLGGGIDALDTLVLVGLYVAYIGVILRGEHDPSEEHTGVPAYLQGFHRPLRVATVTALFAYSGLIIFTAVEPFAHGLEDLGLRFGVPEFFMIQWIAPLASESPELIVVLVLVNKARSTAGFNALISSKLNQWTLLIGTIAVVYSLGFGSYGVLPFDSKQGAEIWITAAQSFFALGLIVDFRISIREAVVLFVLFVSQVVLEFLVVRDLVVLPVSTTELLLVYTAVYLALGTGLLVARRAALVGILRQTRGVVRSAVAGPAEADADPGAD
jgi:cation:H+ antiporter